MVFEKSLKIKILRAALISHGWVNCLNPHYHALDPLQYAWRVENGTLEPHWYEGSALPSKEELDNYNDAQLEEFSVDEFLLVM